MSPAEQERITAAAREVADQAPPVTPERRDALRSALATATPGAREDAA